MLESLYFWIIEKKKFWDLVGIGLYIFGSFIIFVIYLKGVGRIGNKNLNLYLVDLRV